MKPSDLPNLAERLGELAECFPGGKKPTEGSLKVWLETLREFSIDDVLFVLVDLPKRVPRMPTPNDVYKACGERRGKQIERAQVAHKAAEFSLPHDPQSPTAIEELKKITAILGSPRPGGKDWIEKIFEREEVGDPTLSFSAVQLARETRRRE